MVRVLNFKTISKTDLHEKLPWTDVELWHAKDPVVCGSVNSIFPVAH